MSKILSFDVGIKNLAYCLLEITNDNFKILKWDVIDLTTNTVNYYCCFVNGNNSCKKKATKYINYEGETQYYCKNHSSKIPICMIDTVIPQFNLEDKKNKCKIDECKKECYNKLENSFYCDIHKKKLLNNYICNTPKCKNIMSKNILTNDKIIGWCDEHSNNEYEKFIKNKTKNISQNANKITLCNLCHTMYKKLNEISDFSNVSKVYIENQPTFINPTMKTISAFLFSYFINRSLKEITQYKVEDIIFCSPSNKIKVAGIKGNDILENTKKEIVYAITKDIAVKCCSELIKDDTDNLKIFNSHDKKDDLADSFLQGFIKSFGSPLPKHFEDKIKNLNFKEKVKKVKKT